MLLIDELKEEHKILLSYLKEANNNFGLNNEISKQKLLLARDLLLNHLKKEDRSLYPVLKKESENNPQLKNYLQTFASEMETITNFVIKFFEKNEKQISPDFSDDLAKISFDLKQRMGREERVLYKEYEKINLG